MWPSPAVRVSSWMELSRSPVALMASGSLTPLVACPRLRKLHSHLTNTVSLYLCWIANWAILAHITNCHQSNKTMWLKVCVWHFPLCPAGGCGVPPAFHNPNMNLADKYITMTSFASGDRVQYVCDVGYVPAGGRRYRTCKDGKWTPLHLKCERKNFCIPLCEAV